MKKSKAEIAAFKARLAQSLWGGGGRGAACSGGALSDG